jgi:hypothetical protein
VSEGLDSAASRVRLGAPRSKPSIAMKPSARPAPSGAAAGAAKGKGGGSCLSEIQRMQRERDERRRLAEEKKNERAQEEKR